MQPEDVENMAEVLYQTLTDSQLLEELQTRGFIRAAEFSWQRAAELTQRLDRRVANGGQGVGKKVEANIDRYQGQPERV